MLIVDDCIVSDNIADICFDCDLASCKGTCCVDGDCGAPLDAAEIPVLQEIYPVVKKYMTPEGVDVVEREGVSSLDVDKLPCTPLVNNRECAYSVMEEGITFCAIEKAWRNGETDFPKPISCHLYPIRIDDYGDFKAVNYHEWDVCRCALAKGRSSGVPLYIYLKEPLVRRFGQEWYDELVSQCAK